MLTIIFAFLLPAVVKIPRAKNKKLKSKVGMVERPVLLRQIESSSASSRIIIIFNRPQTQD